MRAGIYIYIYITFIAISSWFIYKIDIYTFIKYSGDYSKFIEQNYIHPDDVKIHFAEKRNLIYIYLESMEISYADKANGGLFDVNMIPNLTRIAHENEDFTGSDTRLNGAYAPTGSTWTMASVFSQSTGLPLNIPLADNAMDSQDSFFPDIVGIGDILKRNGYTNVLIQGSDATFSGAKNFFRDHGGFKIVDYNYIMNNKMVDDGSKNQFWGIDDFKLFEVAKNEINNISKTGQPFNITILTIDTHSSNGYLSKYCETVYDNNYKNSIICSDRQVADFIKWISDQDFYEDTTIVVTGDHPTMQSGFIKEREYTRKVFTCYINTRFKNEKVDNYRIFSTFDNFPTTLSAIGAVIEGDRLGLGTNLFSKQKTLSEQFGYKFQDIELSKRTNFFPHKSLFVLKDEMMKGIQNFNPLIYSKRNKETGKITLNIIGFDIDNNIDKIFIKLYNYNDLQNYKKIFLDKVEIYDTQDPTIKIYYYKTDIDLKDRKNHMFYITFYAETSEGEQENLGVIQGDLSLKTINLSDYLDYIRNDKYTIFISTKGNINSNISQELKDNFNKLGLSLVDLNGNFNNYIAVIDGKNVYEKNLNTRNKFSGYLAIDKKQYIIISKINKSSIIIDGIDYSHNQKGLNFVVYDNEMGRVADIATFDLDNPASFLNGSVR